MSLLLQIVLILLGPYIGIRLLQWFPTVKWLSPVVWSYALGILVANFDIFPIDISIATHFSHAAILFAIPLLLYSTDLIAWFKHAQSTVLSFALCIVAGLVSSTVMAVVFQGMVGETWQLSAMLVGVYTGGTPNLNAIGLALQAQESTFILLNAADSVCGAVYIIFLSSVAPVVLASFFPKFDAAENKDAVHFNESSGFEEKQMPTVPALLKMIGLTLLVIAASVGITYGLSGGLDNIVLIILSLTTFSVLASLSPKVRQIKGTFEVGEYILLIFCVAIGMLADFHKLIQEGGTILLFTAAVMGFAILLHHILAALFRIDRDTVMITSTAAIMGPVFIGQIASVLNNKQIVFFGHRYRFGRLCCWELFGYWFGLCIEGMDGIICLN